jgi:PAS domain S-box-containing protein
MQTILKKTFLITLMLSFCLEAAAQQGSFQFRGRVYNHQNQSMGDVKFEVFEGLKSIDSFFTAQNGIFAIRLKLNSVYTIEISKKKYATKRIAIDAKVPAEFSQKFFEEFNFIILDNEENADAQSKSGLPVMKYFFEPEMNRFVAEETGKRVVNYVTIYDVDSIEKLNKTINLYKNLYNQQLLRNTEAEKMFREAILIKKQAKEYADSLRKDANTKAIEMTRPVAKDTIIVISGVEKQLKEIKTDEYKTHGIDEKEFQNKGTVKESKQKINFIKTKTVQTPRDSIDRISEELKIQKEFISDARLQLQIELLNARTREDSIRIQEKELKLNSMEREVLKVEQELENARTKLLLKELEIKNKNMMLIAFLVGSILLFILLLFIYFSYRDKQRVNKILEYQNQELEKLSIVASETSNAVIITDQQGNYNWVNKGYTRLFGYQADEVTGLNAKNLFATTNTDQINQLINKAISEGEPVNYEFETQTKEQRKVWVQTTLTPILGKNNEVTKLIAIDSDISKTKEAELEIREKNVQLAHQNRLIMDSLNYAKRIQEAMLPSEELIRNYFPESFIYFKPRDIVSGDFYWFSVQENKLFIAAVDCTGHGVPGAFMSLIGNSLLNNIVNERKIHKPSMILTELNNGVNKAFSQRKLGEDEPEDGMDLTMCCFDRDKKEIQIASANHTAILITNGEVRQFDGDEISIGESYSKVLDLEFTNHEFPFQDNSILYLFSDGFYDQIGGPKNKKFMVGNFIEFLSQFQKDNMNIQFDKLNEQFQQWKGDNKQTDDVLVMGIRFKST